MSAESRPLWKLLLAADPHKALTCGECFMILEYFADASEMGIDQRLLIKVARRHLAACPDCEAYYQERLNELESFL